MFKNFLCEDFTSKLMQEVWFRSSHPEVFLGKGVLKICSKFTGERPCRNAISIKLQSNKVKKLQFKCLTGSRRCSQ